MPTMTRTKLISKVHREEIIEHMRDLGLELLYKFQISSKQHQYHVDIVREARETMLFFYLPGKAFIIEINLHERVDHRGEFSAYWTIDLYVHWDMRRIVQAESHKRHEEGRLGEDFTFGVLDETPPHLGFRLTGGSPGSMLDDYLHHFHFEPEVKCEQDSAMDHSELGAVIKSQIEHCSPWVFDQFQAELWANFAPSYTFPGIEQRFWKGFPVGRLRTLVRGGRLFGIKRDPS
jgi:hypothetical protein